MALLKAVVWALIFLTKLRFPPGVSIAIALMQVCYKVASELGIKSLDKQLLLSLLTTSNRPLIIKPEQAM